jgi:predicted DNA-binding transcriptional regulator AlpA
MQDRWLSVDDLADYLGVSKDTVYTWVTSKGMPGHNAQSAQYDRWIQFNLTDESGFKVTAPRPSLHLE